MRPFTIVTIVVGVLAGVCLALLSTRWAIGTVPNILLLNLGSGLIATGFIGVILDLFWSRERARTEAKELEPIYNQFSEFTNQLGKLEGRMEAFKQLGFNYCHASRRNALASFLGYAKEVVNVAQGGGDPISASMLSLNTVNIVSSSARGLMGYLDREPRENQRQWRNLITEHPHHFRMLLTHPAYAHLRQPAEERASGDIELEILKTSIYLHLVAGMTERELRFYRGSPTVFMIQAGKHVLLNPYPYGKMAMDTLCLEFESEHEDSYVSDFVGMHFNHTWAFMEQPGKQVDGKPLVEGIKSFRNILEIFSECTFVEHSSYLRLTGKQVEELDEFTSKTSLESHRKITDESPSERPFTDYARQRGLKFGDEKTFDETI